MYKHKIIYSNISHQFRRPQSQATPEGRKGALEIIHYLHFPRTPRIHRNTRRTRGRSCSLLRSGRTPRIHRNTRRTRGRSCSLLRSGLVHRPGAKRLGNRGIHQWALLLRDWHFWEGTSSPSWKKKQAGTDKCWVFGENGSIYEIGGRGGRTGQILRTIQSEMFLEWGRRCGD